MKTFEFSDQVYTLDTQEERELLHNPSVLVDLKKFIPDDSFHSLIVKMKDICRNADKDTVTGISAIQLGIPLSMFVLQFNGSCTTYINPQIQSMQDYSLFVETSYSSPGKRYVTVRASKIDVYYTTPTQKIIGVRLNGLLAAIFQQMVDCLVGVQLGDEDSPFIEYTEDIQYLTPEQEKELRDKILSNLNSKLKK